MSYTSYGLFGGLVIVAITLAVVTWFYMLFKAGLPKKNKRVMFQLYISIVIFVLLDTLMWAFDIKTGVIDFLATTESGNTEQVTIFGIASLLYLAYMVYYGNKEQELNKIKLGE